MMEDISLKASMADFFRARYRKLEKKEKQGYSGWEWTANEGEFIDELRTHAKKKLTQRNLINIANYCNFLWQMLENEKE